MSDDTGGVTTAPHYVLEAKGLCRSFGGFRAVEELNLSIKEGSVHALIGPNGAGKTTVFNLLTKFLPVSAGAIYFRGRDITKTGPADVARLGVVRSFQISATFGQLTAFENVRIALQGKQGLGWQFWRSREALSVLSERTWELLEMVGLEHAASTKANELPYGRKRALELATTLALEPDVMLLDEPMAGLAHTDIPGIARLIDRARAGRTVLMVEHNLNVVEDICDAVTVLQRGRILCEGTYAKVSADPQVREAYMGIEDDE